jgi:hypothetical protein
MWVSILALLLACAALGAAGVLVLTRRRRRVHQHYQRKLERALADGVLSPEDMAELDRFRTDKDLSQAEVRMVARAIYRGALRDAMRSSRLRAEEHDALRRLQSQLGLTEADLGGDLNQVGRLRMLAGVEAGELPAVDSPVPLVPHEQCHWVVQCTLADELGLPRSARTELRGIRFDVTGNEPFNASGERAALRPSDRILPTDLGILAVTSRRTVFQGAKRTLNVPHARLEAITLHRDGLRLDEIGGSMRGFLLVEDAELTTAILLQAARRRRAEIRPKRSGRTA